MNLEALEYFCALGEVDSFAKAAQRFYISQQGFNKAITSLEAETGCQLVERTNRGVSLTEDGRRFLDGAREIVQTYRGTLLDMSAHRNDVQTVRAYAGRMAISPACALSIIAPMEERGLVEGILINEVEFLAGLELLEQKRWLFLTDVPRFAIDEASFDRRYEILPVVRTWIGVVGRSDLVGKAASSVSPAKVAEMTLGIYDNETTRLMYESIFVDCPMEDVARRSTNFDALMANAQRGRYAVLLDSFQWRQHLMRGGRDEGMSFVRLEDGLQSIFGFVFSRDNPPDEETRAFAESFARVFSNVCI